MQAKLLVRRQRLRVLWREVCQLRREGDWSSMCKVGAIRELPRASKAMKNMGNCFGITPTYGGAYRCQEEALHMLSDGVMGMLDFTKAWVWSMKLS